MDTKQQEQENTEQEQSEGRQNRLVEIYKLHAQLINDISNRQTATSRFYATLMSALLVIFFTFLQRQEDLFPADIDRKTIIGYSMLIMGYLGILLSLIWAFSIRFYNSMISYKYKVLKKLETKLEFQFFAHEWKNVDKRISGIPYQLLPKVEILIPYFFLFLFILTVVVSFILLSERIGHLLKHIFNG